MERKLMTLFCSPGTRGHGKDVRLHGIVLCDDHFREEGVEKRETCMRTFIVQVLCVAHTGIAATLLINGCTVHRQFSLPIDLSGTVTCSVPTGSEQEKTLKEADMIIWDEACMSDKRVSVVMGNR